MVLGTFLVAPLTLLVRQIKMNYILVWPLLNLRISFLYPSYFPISYPISSGFPSWFANEELLSLPYEQTKCLIFSA